MVEAQWEKAQIAQERHSQQRFFSGYNLLPRKLRQRSKESSVEAFWEEALWHIDEELFANLHTDKASRPNVPVSVLVGMEIVKSGFGSTGEELHAKACFILSVWRGLGLRDLRTEVSDLCTVYSLRNRVREYTQRQGVTLFQKAFEQGRGEQVEGWGRRHVWMDSTEVLSNLANQ